jgi:type VI secretion system secreted protein VgrG
VVVSFLDGNPDRPLITGCVYNEDNLPAWGFPAAAHQTGIQSRSSPGGAGMCEMVIHDKAGHELINIFSQKDMVRTVLNNDSTEVRGPKRTVAVTTGMQATTVQQEVTLESKTSFITETAKQHIALTSTDAHIAQTAKTHIALQSQTDAVFVKAATGIRLEVGDASLEMRADGTVLINGTVVQIVGSTSVDLNP